MQFFSDCHIEINYYNTHCKGIEENNKTGNIRNLFQKIQEIKGKFKPRLGMLNDPQGYTLPDQEGEKKEILKREIIEEIRG